MSAITAEEAFKLLGLSSDCTQVELQKAFHELSRETHPDTGKGQSAAQARLNEAREVAAAYIADHKTLIPIKLESALLEFERKLVAEQAARQADDIAHRAIRRYQRRFRNAKYLAFLLAALAAAFGWLRESILPGLSGLIPSDMSDILRDQFKTFAVALAAGGGILHFLSQRHALLMEAFKESLDDVETCAAELATAVDYDDQKEIRQGSLRSYPENSHGHLFELLSILWRFDPTDRTRLLVAKGLEHGLLEGIGPKNILPASGRLFKVTFTPSQFRPRPRPPERSPEPMPPAVAAFMALFMIAIGGALASWALSIHSGWKYIPGVLSGLFLLGSLGGVIIFLEAFWKRGKEKAEDSSHREGKQ
jgi:hypothetical protein